MQLPPGGLIQQKAFSRGPSIESTLTREVTMQRNTYKRIEQHAINFVHRGGKPEAFDLAAALPRQAVQMMSAAELAVLRNKLLRAMRAERHNMLLIQDPRYLNGSWLCDSPNH
jgi:hypothetical protein